MSAKMPQATLTLKQVLSTRYSLMVLKTVCMFPVLGYVAVRGVSTVEMYVHRYKYLIMGVRRYFLHL
jgi:hypothetical protein